MSDLISRQAAIDALAKILSDREGGNTTWWKPVAESELMPLPSAQPDLDSAYTEGYTAAESKYRAMWDEMQANIKEKAFGKRKGLIHTADIDAMPTIEERKTGKWIDAVIPNDNGGLPVQVCDQCNTFFPLAYTGGGHHYCPNCGAKMVQEGEDNGQTD